MKELRSLSLPRLVFRFSFRMTIFAFILIFAFKLVTRVNPIAMVQVVLSDISLSLFTALRMVFLWPFKLAVCIPGWLFREALAFFRDIRAALGFVPLFAMIAVRLAGAYLLLRYVAPIALLICVFWPLDYIFGGPAEEEKMTNSDPNAVAVTALLMLLDERRRQELAATERATRRRRRQ